MDALHRLVSGVDGGDAGHHSDDEEDDEEAGFPGETGESDFRRATNQVAKEGLREGLAHGKEIDLQKVGRGVFVFHSSMRKTAFS